MAEYTTDTGDKHEVHKTDGPLEPGFYLVRNASQVRYWNGEEFALQHDLDGDIMGPVPAAEALRAIVTNKLEQRGDEELTDEQQAEFDRATEALGHLLDLFL